MSDALDIDPMKDTAEILASARAAVQSAREEAQNAAAISALLQQQLDDLQAVADRRAQTIKDLRKELEKAQGAPQ